MSFNKPQKYKLNDLLDIMAKMRQSKGCPWVKAQTLKTLTAHMLEEAYELVDVVENQCLENALIGELADLLNLIIFYAEIAKEQDLFDFDTIIDHLAKKLIRRHPDVFANGKLQSIDALEKQWQMIKQKERDQTAKQAGKTAASVFDEIAVNLPALSMANKLQLRVSSIGFDWDNIADVMAHLVSEVNELQEVLLDPQQAIEELGDLMFSCVNLSRHLKADPEQVLRQANKKFKQRFQGVEAALSQNNTSAENASLEELERLWQQEKTKEKISEKSQRSLLLLILIIGTAILTES